MGAYVMNWGEIAVPSRWTVPKLATSTDGKPAFDVTGTSSVVIGSIVYEMELAGDVVFLVFTVTGSPTSPKVLLGHRTGAYLSGCVKHKEPHHGCNHERRLHNQGDRAICRRQCP